jgi:tetratricopeptide (TPR) repeat protein
VKFKRKALTHVTPDSISRAALRMFNHKFLQVVFSRVGSGNLSFGRCFKGAVTILDQCRLPTLSHRLPVNWGLYTIKYQNSYFSIPRSLKMVEKKSLSKYINKLQDYLYNSRYKRAVKLFRKIESKFPDNFNTKFIKVGTLIDSGANLNRKNLVEEGIKSGLDIIEDLRKKENITTIYYNIANAYNKLYHFNFDENNKFEYFINNEYLQKSKKYFRKSLEYKNDIKDEELKQLLCNYGNCLDSLGRGIESINAYNSALDIDSDFSMAIANKAKATRYFAEITGDYRVATYVTVYQKISNLLDNVAGSLN